MNSNTKFSLKLLRKIFPIYVILFYIIPFIFFLNIIVKINTIFLYKVFLFYILCLIVPLFILYIVICLTLLIGDIISKDKKQKFITYFS